MSNTTNTTKKPPSVVFAVGVPIPGEGMGNHAYYLVQGLHRHHMLRQAHVMRYRGADAFASQIKTAYFTERAAYRLARYTHSDQYVLRDNLFDAWVACGLPQADVFYGWTHHALWSLKTANRRKMVTVLERANAHPLTYSRLLQAEYRKHGVAKGPYHPLILKKHLRELDEADYIAVTSQFTKQSLLEHGIDEQRILLTPLGVERARFAPRESPPKDDRFRVLYVGQLCLRKGIPYLLEAWRALRLKNAELVLAGDVVEELRDMLRQYRGLDETIVVRSHVDDPVALYQQASVCILPTLEDGFGLVVLEAMACGVPVIVTEHAGAKDCVRPDLDGFILPPYSVDSLADALAYCAANRERLAEMGRHARQQAEQYSWQRYQDGLAAHLRRVAG